MVDAVVMVVLLELCVLQESQHGIGWAAVKHNIVFYVDDGCIMVRNFIWVKNTLTALVHMFERVFLQTNQG